MLIAKEWWEYRDIGITLNNGGMGTDCYLLKTMYVNNIHFNQSFGVGTQHT